MPKAATAGPCWCWRRHDGQTHPLVLPGATDLPPGTVLRATGRFAAAAPSDLEMLGPVFLVEDFERLGQGAGEVGQQAQPLIVDPARAPRPRTVGVFLLNFKNDDRQPITVEEARRRIFTDPDSTRAFYQEQSYGLLNLVGKAGPQGDVFGWYTITAPNRPCSPSPWGDEALALAKAQGVDTEGYDNYVFLFPATPACPYLGLGQQPGKRTWINGASIATLTHEIGHNIGTPHASARVCTDNDGKRVTAHGQCSDSEYGNPFDVMGAGFYHTHAYNKAQARWLSGPNLVDVTADGVYTLVPQERPSAAAQLLSLGRGDDSYYHLEYRRPFGFDKFPPDAPAVNGLIVVQGGNLRRFGNSYLLDMNPATSTLADAPLAVGQSFEDTEAGVKFTLMSAGADEAKVKVELKPSPVQPAPLDAAPAPATDAAVAAIPSGAMADAGGAAAVADAAITATVDAPAPDAMAAGRDAGSTKAPRPAAPAEVPGNDSASGCGCALGAARAGGEGEGEGTWPGLSVLLGLGLRLGKRSWRSARRRRHRRPGNPSMRLGAALLWLSVGLLGGAATLPGCGAGEEPPVSAARPPEKSRDAARVDVTAEVAPAPDREADGSVVATGDDGGRADASATDAPASSDGRGGSTDLRPTADAAAPFDSPPPIARIYLYPAPAAIETTCQQYALVRCAKIKDCDASWFAGAYQVDEICRARHEEACRTDFLVAGRKELARDRAACTRAIMGQSCRDFWLGRALAACEFPPGALTAGATCFRTSQCGPGLRCKLEAGGCGTCAPAIPVGGDCGWWAEGCAAGTACYDDRCLAPRKRGEPCKMTSAPCEIGAACAAAGCVEQTGSAGTACAAADVCDPSAGVYCNITTGLCEPLPAAAAAGQPCATYNGQGAPLSCGWDGTCFGTGGVTAARSCVAKADLGQACDPSKGQYCKAPGSCARGQCVMPTIVSEGSYAAPACR